MTENPPLRSALTPGSYSCAQQRALHPESTETILLAAASFGPSDVSNSPLTKHHFPSEHREREIKRHLEGLSDRRKARLHED